MGVVSAYGQPRKVKFGWIAESFSIYARDPLVWIATTFLAGLAVAILPLVTRWQHYVSLGSTIVIALLFVAAVIPCGLGLLVVYPMYIIIAALAYRDLLQPTNYGTGFPTIDRSFSPEQGVWPPPPNNEPGAGDGTV